MLEAAVRTRWSSSAAGLSWNEDMLPDLHEIVSASTISIAITAATQASRRRKQRISLGEAGVFQWRPVNHMRNLDGL